MRYLRPIAPFLPLALLAPLTLAQSLENSRLPGTLATPFGNSTTVQSAGDTNGDGSEDFIVWGISQSVPLVEEARMHSGADGTLLHRTTLGSTFVTPGLCLSVLGDLDADGVLDYARGGSHFIPSGAGLHGFVRIHSGMTGNLLFEIPYTASLFPAGDGVSFGQGIGSVGDVTGDGIPDIGIGAPFEHNSGGGGGGGVYVFSGVLGTPLYHVNAPAGSEAFGETITRLGDLSGDGTPDYLIGAINENTTGAVYAISGANGATLYRIPGEANDQYLGLHLEPMGDLDGDGMNDFIIGTRTSSASQGSYARIKAYSGASGTLLFSQGYGTQGAIRLGSISSTIDSNQDGFRDLLIAAQSDRGTYPGLGLVLHVSGADGSVLSVQEGDLPNMGVASVTSLGDRTGNGHADWAVGHFSTLGLDQAGMVQIMHGGCTVAETPSCNVPANSTGVAASLQAVACGEATSQGQMQIRMTDLPSAEFGFVLMAPQGGSFPLAGSTLCLGGAITRLNSPTTGMFRSDDNGYASRLVDWSAFPQGAMVLPGSTWHFQVMHRDQGLATSFHLTHALAITF
ncbi:MAG: hypothetical protein ACI87O_002546 [Planctomycetota bacterium]|jgi:hypothetical protein